MQKITFVLPGYITEPDGQIKTIIQLGQKLSERGHTVTLVYPLTLSNNTLQSKIDNVKRMVKDWKGESGVPNTSLYYSDISEINMQVVKEIKSKYIPEADNIIATDWKTSQAIQGLPGKHGQKYLLVQSWEPDYYRTQKVLEVYQSSNKKIALSQWIKNKLVERGQNPIGPLNNFVNQNYFYCINSFKEREYDIGLYLDDRSQKSGKAIKILKKLKKKVHSIKAMIVSSGEPGGKIPEWVDLYPNPGVQKKRELFNSLKVLAYYGTSEGWPKEPMQAMACGCVVVSNSNPGTKEYLNSGENGFIVEGERKWIFFNTLIENMVIKISYILSNPEKGAEIAQNANQITEKYDPDDTIDILEEELS